MRVFAAQYAQCSPISGRYQPLRIPSCEHRLSGWAPCIRGLDGCRSSCITVCHDHAMTRASEPGFPMRLRHIEIFEAIRRTGSLTEAAQILHVSQPAASKMLANAEAQLGFKLFERVKGRLRATREAEILAPQVTQLTQNLSSVRRLAASLRYSQRGHLRVGCAPALG